VTRNQEPRTKNQERNSRFGRREFLSIAILLILCLDRGRAEVEHFVSTILWWRAGMGDQDVNERRLIFILAAVAILACLALGAANLFLGDLNQDEGWYLYAARLVSQGKLPYVDFASTQGPVMPFVYALAEPLAAGWGVAGGRLFTFLLGLACAFGAAGLAASLVGPRGKSAAALTAFTLIGVNVYQSYFFTVVKTYALAGLFLTLGFLVLVSACRTRRASWAFVSGVLLCLAAGTRMSAGAVLPAVFLGLVVDWRRKRAVSPGMVCGFGAGVLLSGFLTFVPFLVKAPEALWFALVEYHAGRDAGGVVKQLAYKAGFVSRVVYAYLPAVGLGLAVRLYGRSRSARAAPAPGSPVTAWIWVSAAAVTLVHFMAPFPYDDYQAMIFPLFAVGVAAMFVRTV